MTNISCSFLVMVACLFIIQLSKHIKSCISQYLLFSFVYCKYCMLFIVYPKYCSLTFMYCKYHLFSLNLVQSCLHIKNTSFSIHVGVWKELTRYLIHEHCQLVNSTNKDRTQHYIFQQCYLWKCSLHSPSLHLISYVNNGSVPKIFYVPFEVKFNN